MTLFTNFNRLRPNYALCVKMGTVMFLVLAALCVITSDLKFKLVLVFEKLSDVVDRVDYSLSLYAQVRRSTQLIFLFAFAKIS